MYNIGLQARVLGSLDEPNQKSNSLTYIFVEVSGHNLKSSHIWGFRIQCLHYKTVPNHYCSRGGGVKSVSRGDCEYIARRKTLKAYVPITSKNSASDNSEMGWQKNLGCANIQNGEYLMTYICAFRNNLWRKFVLLEILLSSQKCRAKKATKNFLGNLAQIICRYFG